MEMPKVPEVRGLYFMVKFEKPGLGSLCIQEFDRERNFAYNYMFVSSEIVKWNIENSYK